MERSRPASLCSQWNARKQPPEADRGGTQLWCQHWGAWSRRSEFTQLWCPPWGDWSRFEFTLSDRERDAVLCIYFTFPPNIKVLEGKLWETTLRQVEGQAALGQTSRCSQDSPYRPRTVKPLKRGNKGVWKSSSQGGTFQQQVNTQQTLNLTSGQGNAK